MGGSKFIQGTFKFKILWHIYMAMSSGSYIVLMLPSKIWAGDPDLNVITVQIIPDPFDVEEIAWGNYKE